MAAYGKLKCDIRPDDIRYIKLYVYLTVTKVKEDSVATPLIDTGHDGVSIAPKLQSCGNIDYYVIRYLERHTADYAPFTRTRLAIACSGFQFNSSTNYQSITSGWKVNTAGRTCQ